MNLLRNCILLFTLINTAYCQEGSNVSDYERVFEYLNDSRELQSLVHETFEFAVSTSKNTEVEFCISKTKIDLDLNDFDSLPESIIQENAVNKEIENIPEILLSRSKCNLKETINVFFSNKSSNIMVVELWSEYLNPGGGVSFGPSLHILFLFDQEGRISGYLHERYQNG